MLSRSVKLPTLNGPKNSVCQSAIVASGVNAENHDDKSDSNHNVRQNLPQAQAPKPIVPHSVRDGHRPNARPASVHGPTIRLYQTPDLIQLRFGRSVMTFISDQSARHAIAYFDSFVDEMDSRDFQLTGVGILDGVDHRYFQVSKMRDIEYYSMVENPDEGLRIIDRDGSNSKIESVVKVATCCDSILNEHVVGIKSDCGMSSLPVSQYV
jgi:hypothetical protein